MVPVLVSAVLSFGILFIWVVNNTFTTGALADTGSGTFCTTGEFMVKYCIEQNGGEEGWYSSRIIIGGDGSEGGGDYAITFEFGSMLSEFVGSSAGKTLSGAGEGFADGAKDIFAHIILSLIALAVMWMGVKAAVSTDEITKMAFDPFAKFGASVGNFVTHIPSYLPTPHPAFAAFNPATFDALATKINKNVDSTVAESRTRLDDMITGKTSALERSLENLGNTSNDLSTAFTNSVKRFEDSWTRDVEIAKKILNKTLDRTTFTDAEKPAVTALTEKINNARTNKELQEALEEPQFASIKQKVKANWADIDRFSSVLWSSSTSSSGSSNTFSGHTISSDWSVKTPGGTAPITATNISPAQQSQIKSLFFTKREINNLNEIELENKLKQAGFDKDIVEKLNKDELTKVAINLATAARVPD